jgi:tetratricopeptide (TPR) repeat protein
MTMTRPNRLLPMSLTIALGAGLLAPSLVGCRASGNAHKDPGNPARVTKSQSRQQRQTEATDAVVTAQQRMNEGDLEAALREFERAIAVNPAMTVAYIGAGDIHRRQGNLPAAEKNFARAAQLEPRNFDAQFGHGLVLQLMNRLGESIRAYLRALAIRPGDFETNLNIATAYLQVGEPAQALAYAQRAVSVTPDSGEARVNLGATYAALDQHEQAVIEFQQAAELMELSPRLLLSLADSLGHASRYAEMVATLDQLIRIEPSAIAYERMGSGLFRLRRYDAAQEAFEKSLEMDPAHFPALNGVAVCQLNEFLWSGQRDVDSLGEAVVALRRSLQLQPGQPQIVELLRRYGAGANRAQAAGG